MFIGVPVTTHFPCGNVDESASLSDLGGSFNAFSLEYDALSAPLERIGQSADAEVVDLHGLIRQHELLADSLREIVLYTDAVQRTLHNHTGKRVDLEAFHEQINSRRNTLLQLESAAKLNDAESADHALVRGEIEQLETQRKQQLAEMNEYTLRVLADIDRVFEYFGRTWHGALRMLAEFQCKWHESAVQSWQSSTGSESERP